MKNGINPIKNIGGSRDGKQKKLRLTRIYVPAKPTNGMCDGVPISSYRVSAAEKNYGYKGSGYYLTRLKSVSEPTSSEYDGGITRKRAIR